MLSILAILMHTQLPMMTLDDRRDADADAGARAREGQRFSGILTNARTSAYAAVSVCQHLDNFLVCIFERGPGVVRSLALTH